MDKLIDLVPKSFMPFLAFCGLILIAMMARETMMEVKNMSVQVSHLQTQLSIVQATMVTRQEVLEIVREELDRENK